ncbi:hypothetical protein QQ045_010773 [Rhodiola kirilowii]
MAFGKNGARQAELSRRADDIQATVEDFDNSACQEDDQPEDDVATAESSENNQRKPLLDEVIVIGVPKGKNVGDRTKLQRLRKKVEDAESLGVSPSLTKSTINSSHGKSAFSSNPIAASFATVERHQVDVTIVRALCANGIPFNVLRNPDFINMLKVVNRAPKDYKPPSRGSMFLYAEDFSGVEKIGKAIAEFILKSIDEVVGPSNVLQVVTDNAANCKAAGKEIEKVAKTRFASHYILLKRLSDCREALATTTVLRAWKDWVTDCADERFADGEGQKMGEVYEKMDCMIGEISDIMKNNKYTVHAEKMNEILVARWEKMNIPMHCLGFALNSFFYDINYLRSPAPGGTDRRAPNLDKEVVSGVLQAFEKIGEDESERRILRDQMAKFQGKEGIFGSNAAKEDAATMTPMSWWSTYGAETSELAEIASKVLSQPISSSSAEIIWSTYSHIHNIKRNHLNANRADKLVFIHSNIRLISRFTSNYKEGPIRKWDIDPESSHLDDSTLRLIDLSLMEDGGASSSNRKRT